MTTRYKMGAQPERCTGCLLCQLACTQVKTSAYGLSQALLEITRIGFDERYDVRFGPRCDACGFCVNYCAYDAIARVRSAAPAAAGGLR